MKKTTIVLLIILFVGMACNKYLDKPKYILNDTDSVRQLRINDVSIEESEILNEITKLLQATQYGKKHKVLRLNHDDIVKYNISFMYGEKLRHLLLGEVNVIYESSDVYFEVVQGEELQEAIDLLLSEKKELHQNR